jgi:hypothetical protein
MPQTTPLKRRPNDKILDNSYNAGNIEHENFKTPSIDNTYAEDHLESNYNSEEYYRKQKLHKNIYAIVQASDYAQYLKTKAPKSQLAEIFNLVKIKFVEGHDHQEYTHVEFFTAITEVFDVTFDNLYANIYTTHKEQIISELDTKYAIFKKRGLNPLF